MTCHEFQSAVTPLSLSELASGAHPQISEHATACARCGNWLRERLSLAGGLQMLQQRTANLSAAPHVEQALLRAFRDQDREPVELSEPHRLPPLTFRLSRMFEVAAYVAVAAALAIGIFLGLRLVQPHAGTSASVASNHQAVDTTASPAGAPRVAANSNPAASGTARTHAARVIPAAVTVAPAASADSDYVALMFCDPLSCSDDAEVVRMEIPEPAGGEERDAEPQVADVVVGPDGVVRAIRMVN